MISRRNIRVKVMQTLYSIDSMNGEVKPGEAISILTKKIEQSRQIFTYLVYFITEVARYSETDARQKASKHLPTAADLNINTKIAGNELLWKIVDDAGFKATIAELKPQHIIDTELLKKYTCNSLVRPNMLSILMNRAETISLRKVCWNLFLPT